MERVRVEYRPMRRRLPDERKSLTHKFSIAGHEGYITVGLYDDGTPGEMFIRMAKGGSVISGLIDAFATSTSIALQYGVPLKVLVNKFVHLRFEPSGFTSNPNIRIAKSIIDYLFRWLAMKFLPTEDQVAVGVNLDVQTLAEAGRDDVEASMDKEMRERLPLTPSGSDSADIQREHAKAQAIEAQGRQMNIVEAGRTGEADPHPVPPPSYGRGSEGGGEQTVTFIYQEETSNALTMSFDTQSDAPPCDTCGAIMVRNGACYKCMNCGSTSGCS